MSSTRAATTPERAARWDNALSPATAPRYSSARDSDASSEVGSLERSGPLTRSTRPAFSSFLRGSSFLRKRPPQQQQRREIVVPPSVAAKLQQYRKKRQDNKSQLSLSNLLQVKDVAREVPSSPTRANSITKDNAPPPTRERQASKLVPAMGKMLSFEGPMHEDPLDEATAKTLTYVTPELNKKIRMEVLRQHFFTNRFVGSSAAAIAEHEVTSAPLPALHSAPAHSLPTPPPLA